MPNAAEAMSYTRTQTAQDALFALADRVPLAVVTNGNDGALAIDGSTGEEAAAPALRVNAIDPTGAGDVFDAAITLGTLAGWPLPHRLNFASLCSALAVQEFGGSLAAPGGETSPTGGTAYATTTTAARSRRPCVDVSPSSRRWYLSGQPTLSVAPPPPLPSSRMSDATRPDSRPGRSRGSRDPGPRSPA